MQAGIIASTMVNTNPALKENDERASDFILEFDEPKVPNDPQEKKKKTAEIWMMLNRFADNHNKRLEGAS